MPKPTDQPSRVHLRGFASMTPERRLEVSRKGGASIPAEKRAYSVNRELAAEAGRKGGLARGKTAVAS